MISRNLVEKLRELGYNKQVNQSLMDSLKDKNYSGALPSMLRRMLLNEGYSGSFPEMLKDWEEDGFLKLDEALVQPLFAEGVDGVWIDPSDMSTMFQDSEGTLPVTATGQTVGLMLDKHEEKEQNLFVSGNIISNSWTVEGDTYSRVAGTFDNLRPDGMEAQTYYEITFEVVDVAAGDIRIYRRNAADTSNEVVAVFDTPGVYRTAIRSNILAPSGAAVWFDSNTFTGSLSGISFRKLPGNHLTQPTASKRPTYQTDGALHYLSFDGGDDEMSFDTITSSEWTAIAAASMDASPSVIAMLFGHDTDPPKLGNNNGSPFFRGGTLNNSLSITGGLSDLEAHIFTGAVDGVNQYLLFDGGQERSGLVQGVPSSFNYFGRADVGQFWQGKFFGGVLIASYNSPQQRDQVEHYLALKSGTSL